MVARIERRRNRPRKRKEGEGKEEKKIRVARRKDMIKGEGEAVEERAVMIEG